MAVKPKAIRLKAGACCHQNEDMRCRCGKLLARLTNDGVVIRCARCKREMVIDMADLIVDPNTGWAEVSFKEKSA